MKKLITICFILLASKNWAQCSNAVTPTSQSVSCSTGSYNVSFTATAISPSINVQHDWYSPYNSPGVPMYTSTNAVSVLSAALAPGVYTVVTTDLTASCTSSSTFTIISSGSFPTFTTTSTTNYMIGCSYPLNTTTL